MRYYKKEQGWTIIHMQLILNKLLLMIEIILVAKLYKTQEEDFIYFLKLTETC